MGAVNEILGSRTRVVVMATPGERVQIVAQRMTRLRTGAAVVVGDNGKLVGLLTEREISSAMAACKGDPSELIVSDYMRRDVVSCTPWDTEAELFRLFAEGGTNFVPVISMGRVIGLLSTEDVLASRMDQVRRRLDHLLQISCEGFRPEHGHFTMHLRTKRQSAARTTAS